MAVVSPEALSHGAEINESTARLSTLAQSEVGAPYQSEYPDFWQAGRETTGAAESGVYIWEYKKIAENSPLCAPKYRIHESLR